MANRFQEDIRRIVGIKGTEGGLLPIEDRPRVFGERGIGYVDSRGNFAQVSSGGTGSSGTSTTIPPSHSTSLQPTALDDGIRQSSFDPFNPNTGVIPEGAGVYDVADIIDNIDGPNPFDPNFPNNERLTGITGLEDCETGVPIELFVGTDFFPPEGWDDPNTPPVGVPDDTWQLGIYWEHFGAITPGRFATPAQAAQQHMENINNLNPPVQYEQTNLIQVSSTLYSHCLKQTVDQNGNPVDGPEFCINIAGFSCTGTDPSGPDDYCTTQQPLLEEPQTEWPSDGVMSIKYENGKFVTSEFDTDVPEGYRDGKSTLNFCFGVDRTATLEAGINGGTLLYETAEAGGAPIGTYKYFNDKGELTAIGDPTTILEYRPKAND